YINMLFNIEKVPFIDNILAATFCWILLARYLVFPGMFMSLQISVFLKEAIYEAVQNVFLLGIIVICYFISLCGASWLYYYNKKKGYLILSRPVFINSVTSFVNIFINVYTVRAKTWLVTVIVTVAVTGFFVVLSGILFIFYNNYLLAKL
ncbi:hypothetical protein ASPFODRAFT_125503, partial [Aspergillus luchuensis CBS 106.47]